MHCLCYYGGRLCHAEVLGAWEKIHKRSNWLRVSAARGLPLAHARQWWCAGGRAGRRARGARAARYATPQINRKPNGSGAARWAVLFDSARFCLLQPGVPRRPLVALGLIARAAWLRSLARDALSELVRSPPGRLHRSRDLSRRSAIHNTLRHLDDKEMLHILLFQVCKKYDIIFLNDVDHLPFFSALKNKQFPIYFV